MFLLGCSQKIVSYIDKTAQLDSFHTYALSTPSSIKTNVPIQNREIDELIENYINMQMEKHGYIFDAKPDVVIRYEIISEQHSSSSNRQPIYPYNNYLLPNFENNRTILQSAFLIEMYDFNSKGLVWQSSVDMDKYIKSENKEKMIASAIEDVFSTYLYEAGSSIPNEDLIAD